MRRKILISLLAIAMVGAMIGGGVYAAFSNSETSSSNTFVAGTLDLKTNDADGVTATLQATNMKPGDSVGPETITLKNAGTIDGSTLDIDISYVENDGTEPTDPSLQVDKTPDEFADELIVNTLTYGGVDLLAGITDVDGDGVDMKEVAAADLSGQAGLTASATKDFAIKVTLKDVGNDFQADGIDVTFTFTLNQ